MAVDALFSAWTGRSEDQLQRAVRSRPSRGKRVVAVVSAAPVPLTWKAVQESARMAFDRQQRRNAVRSDEAIVSDLVKAFRSELASYLAARRQALPVDFKVHSRRASRLVARDPGKALAGAFVKGGAALRK